MILKQLKITGFRPFYNEATLRIEPDITVLTGANDTGKSAVLDIIKRLSFGGTSLQDDANRDFVRHSSKPWNEDTAIYSIATYAISELGNYLQPRQAIEQGWEAEIRLRFTTDALDMVAIRDNNRNPISVTHASLTRRPKAVDLSEQEEIRTVVTQSNINPSENKLLELAFGHNYWNRLEALDRTGRNDMRDGANEILNSRLSAVKPEALAIDFYIDFAEDDPLEIQIGVRDKLNSRAPLHVRGSGYQKLVRLMFTLLTIDFQSEHAVLIYDEPENSLHADAQHSFRQVLESFSEHSRIQVLYATHSSAMINPSRPESLRLLSREAIDSRIATTRIDNKPYVDGNFQSVRTQLGILAADSLLFASITVIVEGPSDSRGLNALFRRLIKDSGKEEYSDLNIYHRLTMFFPAGGYGEFDKWLKVAQGNGVLPILLYDGDRESDAQKMDRDNQNVPVICFDKDKEFENIVPPETYFVALAKIVPGNHIITKDEFENWESNAKLPQQMMFTKRVDKWLKEQFATRLDKPEVMAKAIELVDLDKLCMNTIDKLIDEIRKTSKKL